MKYLHDLIEYRVVPVLTFQVVKTLSVRGKNRKKYEEIVGTLPSAEKANIIATCMVNQDRKHFARIPYCKSDGLTIRYSLCNSTSNLPEPIMEIQVPEIA